MQVKDIMTRQVECVNPKDTLVHAAKRMRDLNVGSLPVFNNDRLAGIITDRDITVRATATCRDSADTRVAQVMTPGIQYCFEDDDVAEAGRLMEEQQIRRLVVLNRAERLVGIVSLGDLAVKSGNTTICAEALEQISESPRRHARQPAKVAKSTQGEGI